MRWYRKLVLRRCTALLEGVKRTVYTSTESLHAIEALDYIISSRNIIKYFNSRKTLEVNLTTQTPNAAALLTTLIHVNSVLSDESPDLSDMHWLTNHLTPVSTTTLYDWLADDNGLGLDPISYFRLLNVELERFISVIKNCDDDVSRDYYLRKLSVVYTELLEVFRAVVYCGLLSL